MKLFSILAVLASVMLSGACGGRSPTGPGSSLVHVVAVLGDSLAVSPSKGQSFPAVLQSHIDEAGLDWRVVNHGAGGDTTSDGVRRLDAVLRQGARVLVLALGANDGLRRVEVDRIEDQLAEIIRRAKAHGVEVLLCGMETPPFHGLDYSIAFHQIYPRVATALDIPLVPFLLSGVVLNPDLNGADGVHPNAEGARRIAGTVWPYLEPMLRDD